MSDDKRAIDRMNAKLLLENPLLEELFKKLEASAVDHIVNAAPTDHEARASNAAALRGIRSLRSQLRSLAEEVKPAIKAAIA